MALGGSRLPPRDTSATKRTSASGALMSQNDPKRTLLPTMNNRHHKGAAQLRLPLCRQSGTECQSGLNGSSFMSPKYLS
jgi:hypothetical protein